MDDHEVYNPMGDIQNMGNRTKSASGRCVPALSDDRLYRALAARPRRRLLYLLLERGERSVEELATLLTGWEATETGTMGAVADRDRIRTTLDHIHLPLLTDVGLVVYDRQRGTVEAEPVDPFLEELIERGVDAESQPQP
jgi:DNA-binding transcriptional ArsR family regulator